MIDKYIILNRKPKIITNLFLVNFFLLTGFIIWGINTFTYQNYPLFHSQIKTQNSYYILEVLVPVKEVNEIINQNTLLINKTNYNYKYIKQSRKVIYQNNTNYIKIYLEVYNLEKKYLIEGYHLDIKICLKSEKIINILKNKEEE